MSERGDKMRSLIIELAASFVANEANTDPLITVTNANVSPDFARATIFITVYPEDREEQALVFLKRKGKEFRHFVSSKVDLKHIPFFEFAIDVGERHRRVFDEMLGGK